MICTGVLQQYSGRWADVSRRIGMMNMNVEMERIMEWGKAYIPYFLDHSLQ